MDNSFRVEIDPARLTPEQMIEALIQERVDRWTARQVTMPDRELAVQLAAMWWDYDLLPASGPGCLLPDRMGGYIYVPYDEDRHGLPAELLHRMDMLENWTRNPVNAPALRQIDKLLEKEVNDTCFWEFLDGGNASRIDFNGKVSQFNRPLHKPRINQT